MPRQEIDPWAQVRDYRHAITWLRRQPQIDPMRIGVWGSSYSGGHALVVGAIDRRVKCVVSQVPLVSGSRNLKRLVRADMAAPLREQFDMDREARLGGAAPTMVPVVTSEPNGVAALPTADSWDWFTATGKTRAPVWEERGDPADDRNVGRVRASQLYRSNQPDSLLTGDRGSGSPGDWEEAFIAFNRALEPKRLLGPGRRSFRRVREGIRAGKRDRARLVHAASRGVRRESGARRPKFITW